MNERWITEVLDCIDVIVQQRDVLTTDHIWAELQRRRDEGQSVPVPSDERVMGTAIQRAARLGMISDTRTWEQSVRPLCHHRWVKVWVRPYPRPTP
jgi:hypothetical protein